MLFTRRHFLLLLALLLCPRTASAQQPPPPSHFRLTVWTIRPLVKRTPTPDELQKEALRWMVVQGFDKPQIQIASDPKVLDTLRKVNPLLSIPRIEQKSVVTVQIDTVTAAVLTGGISFQIVVKVKDRDVALAEIGQKTGKARTDEFGRLSAQEIIIQMNLHIPHLDAPVHTTPQTTVIKGLRSVKPGFLYAANPDLSYTTTLAHAAQPGIPEEYKVRQKPADIVLFCLEPIIQKGERK